MSEKTKNYGKSIRSKLLNVSKQEGIFYQTVLTRYFQERVLYRLSQTRYRDHFFLKGGALMYAHERFVARPTLDIDFLGAGISNDGGHIVSAFREIWAHPINPVDAFVPGQQYMGCCRNLFLTPITPILGMQHLCCLCDIHMS
jgi:hypothetical protein